MTGKEVINLIHKLEQEGMRSEKIIEIIVNMFYNSEDKNAGGENV